MTNSSKTKFLNDPQNIIAVGVTLISLCALVVSIIQTSVLQEERELMREHSRASVWPHLDLGLVKAHKKDGSIERFALTLNNNGVGPAIITDVKVVYQDNNARDWSDLIEIMEIPDSIEKSYNNEVFNKRVISIAETFDVLNLDDNLPLANMFFEKLQEENFSIVIYYKSIYDERWQWKDGKTAKIETYNSFSDDEQFY